MSGPFEGLTVVEFGQFVVAPFCAQLLADAGARVIKVEPSGGDPYRSRPDQLAPNETRQFLIKNRGKQSIALDLSHARASGVVHALVEAADVVLINLSPAAIARRGLDYESLSAINPAVIYGAVTAYGQDGPESALGALAIQNNSLAHVHGHDDWRVDFLNEQLPKLRESRASGSSVETVRRTQRPDPPDHTAHYRVFPTADGFLAVGAGSPAAQRRLAETLTINAALADTDPVEFGRLVEDALATRTTERWTGLLVAADVPVAPVRHIDELLFDAHAEQEGLIADYEHPQVGTYRGLGVPIRMSATPLCARTASPSFAADSVDVLADIGFARETIAALSADGAITDRQATHPTYEGLRSN